MSPAELAAFAMLAALGVYAITGGADFGGGVWDLLARGPRADAQRALVERALAPIWEANHVWLILVVVILFSCFPPAFAAIGTALHVPLTLALLGIVARGSAFVFRHYGQGDDVERLRWGRVFAVASALTPLFLGVSLGTLSSGSLRFQGPVYRSGFLRPWLQPFPLAVGLFALALFAYLAAVYLLRETDDPDLQRDFRRRAAAAGGLAGALALACGALAPADFRADLLSGSSLAVVLGTAALSAVAVWALRVGHDRALRACAVGQVLGVVVGWGAAQQPYLVAPDLTIQASAAPAEVLWLLLGALALASLLVLPALLYLLRVFKAHEPDTPVDRG